MASCDHLPLEDLSYALIAKQGSKNIGTALHKPKSLGHPVRDKKHQEVYKCLPIHPQPNKVQDVDFLATKLKKIAPRMCEHFNLEYRIYEAELRDVF